jgi:glycosyltransferase involved in cell wall biosynthesis
MTLEKSRVNGRINGSRAQHLLSAGAGIHGVSAPTALRVSVVIPARNEAQNLPYVLEKIPAWVHEVILVDGLSVDDTVSVARLNFPQIRVVHQTGKGKGNALRDGFVNATGDIIVSLDADGSMDPGEMTRFVDLMDMGFDFVRGSRMLAEGSSEDLTKLRRFGNWVFRTMTNRITGSRYTDLCYGYFAVRRDVLEYLDLRADGFEIETELNIRAHRAGLRTGEVPSSEFCRKHGTSQLRTFKDGFRILFTILRTSFGRQQRARTEERRIHDSIRRAGAGLTAQVPVSLNGDPREGKELQR